MRAATHRRSVCAPSTTCSAIADRWTPGFGYEFLQRDDGYPGLVRAYGLRFAAQPRAMDLSLIYRALAEGQVDVIAGDATSALIDSLDPARSTTTATISRPTTPCRSCGRRALLRRARDRPGARAAGRPHQRRDMRAMNAAVDLERRDPKSVASEFLAQRPSR